MKADAIVVGAGMAGLAAARRLAGSGARVVLVEARDRTGGRVWSQETPRRVTPAELGAEFIHGKAPRTMALLRDLGAAAIDLADGSWMRNERGELTPDDDDFIAAGASFAPAARLERDESVDCFLRRLCSDPRTRQAAAAARAFVEGFEAADPALASARAIAQEWQSGVDSTSSRPLGGYGPLVSYLHDASVAAGAEVRLQTIARSIAWRANAVRLDAIDSSGEALRFEAPKAIVTLPVGVLRHEGDETAVRFEPQLPEEKRAALDELVMGNVSKVLLLFRSAFWEAIEGARYCDAAFFRAAGPPFQAFWTQLPVRGELIAAWAGGPNADSLRDLDPGELIARALRAFGELIGAPEVARREFAKGLTHDWHRDPFARGAYSYVLVGGANARANLAQPVAGTLFFAGEATSTDGQGGTVNGALETGERAADEVLNA